MSALWWWCCCGCWVFRDDFNKDDTTTPPGWYEYSGNWGIDNNRLEEPYAP